MCARAVQKLLFKACLLVDSQVGNEACRCVYVVLHLCECVFIDLYSEVKWLAVLY